MLSLSHSQHIHTNTHLFLQAAKIALASILELALEGLLFSGVTKIAAEQAAAESERQEKLRVEEERQKEEQRREEERQKEERRVEEERQKEERELWEREEKLLALAVQAGQYPLASCQSYYSCLPFSEFYYYVPSLLVLAAEAGQYPFLVSHVVIYPCC